METGKTKKDYENEDMNLSLIHIWVLYGFHAAAAERKTGEIFMVVRGAGRNDFSGAGKVSGDL